MKIEEELEDGLLLPEESETIFEEWAGGSTAKRIKNNAEISVVRINPAFKKKKGNQKPPTLFTCEVCGIELKHPSRIKEHMRIHTGERPFECELCKMRFTQRTPMVNHFRVQHMGDLPFVCSFECGKRFVNKSRKNAHELRHIGLKRTGPPRPHLKPAKKMICSSLENGSHRTSDAAMSHFIEPPSIATEYVTPSYQPLPSPTDPIPKTPPVPTEKAIKDVEEMNARIDDVISTVLSKVLAPIEEEVSLEDLEEKTPLKRPYVSNRTATLAQCNICGLMLKHPSKIAEHIRTHTGEKPFECGECGLTLTKANSLKVHIRRMHTGERPYECSWGCGLKFVTPSVRKEHEMTVHSGIKRYTCVVKGCNATFARRAYLMRHRKNAHPELFTPSFDHVQVANEEAQDPVLNEKDIFFDEPDQLLLLTREEVKMLAHFDEEEFVEQGVEQKSV